MLRRASFAASGLDDDSRYLEPHDDKQRNWLREKSVIPAMKDFLAEPFGADDLSRLQIPLDIPLADVASLVDRGRDELRQLTL